MYVVRGLNLEAAAMAAQGRGGAIALIAIALLIAGAAADGNIVNMYIIGDDYHGWTKGLEVTWLPGKTFYAGDMLGT